MVKNVLLSTSVNRGSKYIYTILLSCLDLCGKLAYNDFLVDNFKIGRPLYSALRLVRAMRKNEVKIHLHLHHLWIRIYPIFIITILIMLGRKLSWYKLLVLYIHGICLDRARFQHVQRTSAHGTGVWTILVKIKGLDKSTALVILRNQLISKAITNFSLIQHYPSWAMHAFRLSAIAWPKWWSIAQRA